MIIRTISRFEFEQLLAHYTALESLMLEQVEWFSSKSGNLLGVIAKGEGVAGWNYAVFKRDRKGDFPVQKVMSNFFNLNATRVDLLLSMTEITSNQPTAKNPHRIRFLAVVGSSSSPRASLRRDARMLPARAGQSRAKPPEVLPASPRARCRDAPRGAAADCPERGHCFV